MQSNHNHNGANEDWIHQNIHNFQKSGHNKDEMWESHTQYISTKKNKNAYEQIDSNIRLIKPLASRGLPKDQVLGRKI